MEGRPYMGGGDHVDCDYEQNYSVWAVYVVIINTVQGRENYELCNPSRDCGFTF